MELQLWAFFPFKNGVYLRKFMTAFYVADLCNCVKLLRNIADKADISCVLCQKAPLQYTHIFNTIEQRNHTWKTHNDLLSPEWWCRLWWRRETSCSCAQSIQIIHILSCTNSITYKCLAPIPTPSQKALCLFALGEQRFENCRTDFIVQIFSKRNHFRSIFVTLP